MIALQEGLWLYLIGKHRWIDWNQESHIISYRSIPLQ
jgi:hypothetical protein